MAIWQTPRLDWLAGQTPTDADANRWEGNAQYLYDSKANKSGCVEYLCGQSGLADDVAGLNALVNGLISATGKTQHAVRVLGIFDWGAARVVSGSAYFLNFNATPADSGVATQGVTVDFSGCDCSAFPMSAGSGSTSASAYLIYKNTAADITIKGWTFRGNFDSKSYLAYFYGVYAVKGVTVVRDCNLELGDRNWGTSTSSTYTQAVVLSQAGASGKLITQNCTLSAVSYYGRGSGRHLCRQIF